jgi:hypothetical protein
VNDDQEKRELRALADELRTLIKQSTEVPDYDAEAWARAGRTIGKASRQGRSDYMALLQKPKPV